MYMYSLGFNLLLLFGFVFTLREIRHKPVGGWVKSRFSLNNARQLNHVNHKCYIAKDPGNVHYIHVGYASS